MAFNLTANLNVALNTGALRAAANQLNSALNTNTQLKLGIDRNSLSGIKQVKSQIEEATNSMESFGRQAGFAAKRFAAFTLTAGSMIAFISTMKEAISAAVDFDREMIRLRQVSSDTVQDVAAVADQITNLSKSFGVSSKDLIGVAVVLKQANLSLSETKDALEAMAQAALAPNFDNLKDTTEGAIAIMKQFKVEAKDLGSALGSVNAVAGEFAVEASDIIEAIRKTGGAFKAAGGNLNELIALFTSVRQTTRESAESIGTGLRTIFTRIQRNDTANALKQVGIELRYTANEARALGDAGLENQFVGPYEAIKRLSAGLSELRSTDPRFSAIVEQLGGYRQISKVIPLIQEFATAQKALGVAQAGSVSLAVNAGQAQDALAVKLQKLKESFFEVGRSIVNSPGFRGLTDTFISAATSVLSLVNSLKGLIPLIAAISVVKIGTGIGSFAKGFFSGASSDGRPTAKKADGGFLRMRTGGIVPGSGSGDKVPALLEPGEMVVPRNQVRRNKYSRGGDIDINDFNTQGAIIEASNQGNASKKTTKNLNNKISFNKGAPLIYGNSIFTYKGKPQKAKTKINIKDSSVNVYTVGQQAIDDLNRDVSAVTEEKGKTEYKLIQEAIRKNKTARKYYFGDEDVISTEPTLINNQNRINKFLNDKGINLDLKNKNNIPLVAGLFKKDSTNKKYIASQKGSKRGYFLESYISKKTGLEPQSSGSRFDFPGFDNTKARMLGIQGFDQKDSYIDSKNKGSNNAISTILKKELGTKDFQKKIIEKLRQEKLIEDSKLSSEQIQDVIDNVQKEKKQTKDLNPQGNKESDDAYKNRINKILRKTRKNINYQDYASDLKKGDLSEVKNIRKFKLQKFAFGGPIPRQRFVGGGEPNKLNNSETPKPTETAKPKNIREIIGGYTEEQRKKFDQKLADAKQILRNAKETGSMNLKSVGFTFLGKKFNLAQKKKEQEKTNVKPLYDLKGAKSLEEFLSKIPSNYVEELKAKIGRAQDKFISTKNIKDLKFAYDFGDRRGPLNIQLEKDLIKFGSIASFPWKPKTPKEKRAEALRIATEKNAVKKRVRKSLAEERRSKEETASSLNELISSIESENKEESIYQIARPTKVFEGSEQYKEIQRKLGIDRQRKEREKLASSREEIENATRELNLSQFSRPEQKTIGIKEDYSANKPVQTKAPIGTSPQALRLQQQFEEREIGQPDIYGIAKNQSAPKQKRKKKTEGEKYNLLRRQSAPTQERTLFDESQLSNIGTYGVNEPEGASTTKLFGKQLIAGTTRPEAFSPLFRLRSRAKESVVSRLILNERQLRRRIANENLEENLRSLRFAGGGLVPGTGNSDTVPMDLPEGSFVIRKSSVNKIGADNLARASKFASGGTVPALLTPGEYVYSPEEANKIGPSRLHSMNRFAKFASGGFAGAIASGNFDPNNPNDIKKLKQTLAQQIRYEDPSKKNKQVKIEVEAQVKELQSRSTQYKSDRTARQSAEKEYSLRQSGVKQSVKNVQEAEIKLTNANQEVKKFEKAAQALTKIITSTTSSAAEVAAANKNLASVNKKLADTRKEQSSSEKELESQQKSLITRIKNRNDAEKNLENAMKKETASAEKLNEFQQKKGQILFQDKAIGETKPSSDKGSVEDILKRKEKNYKKETGRIAGKDEREMLKSDIIAQYRESVGKQLRAKAEKEGKPISEISLQASVEQYTQEFARGKRKAVFQKGEVVGDKKVGQSLMEGGTYKGTGELTTKGKLQDLGYRAIFGSRRTDFEAGPEGQKQFVQARGQNIANKLTTLAVGANLVGGQIKERAGTGEGIVSKGEGDTVKVDEAAASALKASYGFGQALSSASTYAATAAQSLAQFGPVVAGFGAGIAGIVGAFEGYHNGIKEAEAKIREAKIAQALNNLQNIFERVSNGLLEVNDSTLRRISENQAVLAQENQVKAYEESGGNASAFQAGLFKLSGGLIGKDVDQAKLNESLKRSRKETEAAQLVPLTNVLNKFSQDIGKNEALRIKSTGGDLATTNFEDIRGGLLEKLRSSGGGAGREQIARIASAQDITIQDAEKQFIKTLQESFQAEKIKNITTKSIQENARAINSMEALSNAVIAAAASADSFSSKLDTNAALFEGSIGSTKLTSFSEKYGGTTPDFSVFNNAITESAGILGAYGQQFKAQGNAVNVATQILPDILANSVENPISGKDTATQITDALKEGLKQRGITGTAAEQVVSSVGGKVSAEEFTKLLAEAGGDVSKASKKLISDISGPLISAFNEIDNKLTDAGNKYISGLEELAKRQKAIGDQIGRLSELRSRSRSFMASEIQRLPGVRQGVAETINLRGARQDFSEQQQRLTGFGAGAAENPAAIASRLAKTQEQIRAQEQKVQATSKSSNAGADFRNAALELTKLKSQASNLNDALKNLTDQSKKLEAAQAKLAQVRQGIDEKRSLGRKLLTQSPEEQQKMLQGQQLFNIVKARGGSVAGLSTEQNAVLFDFLDNFGSAGKKIADQILDVSGYGAGKDDMSEEKALVAEQARIFAQQEEAQKLIISNQESLQQDYFSNLDSRNEKFYSELQKFIQELQKNQLISEKLGKQQEISKIKDVQKEGKFLGAAGFNTKEDFEKLNTYKGQVVALAKSKQEEERIKKLGGVVDFEGKTVGGVLQNPLELEAKLAQAGYKSSEAEKIRKLTQEQLNVGNNQNPLELAIKLFKKEKLGEISKDQSKIQTEIKGSGAEDKLNKLVDSLAKNELSFEQFDRATASIKELQLVAGQGLSTAADAATERLNVLNAQINQLGGIQVQAPAPVQVGGFAVGGSVFKPRGTDTVPAMLTPGEFVVNKNATQKNLPLLQSINSGKTSYLANGGMVQYYEVGDEVKPSQQLMKRMFIDFSLSEGIPENKKQIEEAQIEEKNNINKLKEFFSSTKYLKKPKDDVTGYMNYINKLLHSTIEMDKFSFDNESKKLEENNFLDYFNFLEKSKNRFSYNEFSIFGDDLLNKTLTDHSNFNDYLKYLNNVKIETIKLTSNARTAFGFKRFDKSVDKYNAYENTEFALYNDSIKKDYAKPTGELHTSKLISAKLKKWSQDEEYKENEELNKPIQIPEKPKSFKDFVQDTQQLIQPSLQIASGFALNFMEGIRPGAKQLAAMQNAKINTREGRLKTSKEINDALNLQTSKEFVESGLAKSSVTSKNAEETFKLIKNQDKLFFNRKLSTNDLAKIITQRRAQAQTLLGVLQTYQNNNNITPDELMKVEPEILFMRGEQALQKIINGQESGIKKETLQNLKNPNQEKIIESYIRLKSFEKASSAKGKDFNQILDVYGKEGAEKDPQELIDKLTKQKDKNFPEDISSYKPFVAADVEGKINFYKLLKEKSDKYNLSDERKKRASGRGVNVLDKIIEFERKKEPTFVKQAINYEDQENGEKNVQFFDGKKSTIDFFDASFQSIIPWQLSSKGKIDEKLLENMANEKIESYKEFNLDKKFTKKIQDKTQTPNNFLNLLIGGFLDNGQKTISRIGLLGYPVDAQQFFSEFKTDGALLKITSKYNEQKKEHERSAILGLLENPKTIADIKTINNYIRANKDFNKNQKQELNTDIFGVTEEGSKTQVGKAVREVKELRNAFFIANQDSQLFEEDIEKLSKRTTKYFKFASYASLEPNDMKETNFLLSELEILKNGYNLRLKEIYKNQPEQEIDNKSKGGLINYLSGGGVPSYAPNPNPSFFKPKGTDTVPAMLSPGEFVINAAATAKHSNLLNAINNGEDVGYSSTGGMIYLEDGGEARKKAFYEKMNRQKRYEEEGRNLVDDKDKYSYMQERKDFLESVKNKATQKFDPETLKKIKEEELANEKALHTFGYMGLGFNLGRAFITQGVKAISGHGIKDASKHFGIEALTEIGQEAGVHLTEKSLNTLFKSTGGLIKYLAYGGSTTSFSEQLKKTGFDPKHNPMEDDPENLIISQKSYENLLAIYDAQMNQYRENTSKLFEKNIGSEFFKGPDANKIKGIPRVGDTGVVAGGPEELGRYFTKTKPIQMPVIKMVKPEVKERKRPTEPLEPPPTQPTPPTQGSQSKEGEGELTEKELKEAKAALHAGGQQFVTNAQVRAKAKEMRLDVQIDEFLNLAALSKGGMPKSRTDTIPAMLTPGEFVVNAKSSAKNSSLLHAINSGKEIDGFAQGGVVGYYAGGKTSGGRPSDRFNVAANMFSQSVSRFDSVLSKINAPTNSGYISIAKSSFDELSRILKTEIKVSSEPIRDFDRAVNNFGQNTTGFINNFGSSLEKFKGYINELNTVINTIPSTINLEVVGNLSASLNVDFNTQSVFLAVTNAVESLKGFIVSEIDKQINNEMF
jgi:TP901 family phage tail tape measure protein